MHRLIRAGALALAFCTAAGSALAQAPAPTAPPATAASAAAPCDPCGNCTLAQTSTPSRPTRAVQFCGSSVAWESIWQV